MAKSGTPRRRSLGRKISGKIEPPAAASLNEAAELADSLVDGLQASDDEPKAAAARKPASAPKRPVTTGISRAAEETDEEIESMADRMVDAMMDGGEGDGEDPQPPAEPPRKVSHALAEVWVATAIPEEPAKMATKPPRRQPVRSVPPTDSPIIRVDDNLGEEIGSALDTIFNPEDAQSDTPDATEPAAPSVAAPTPAASHAEANSVQ